MKIENTSGDITPHCAVMPKVLKTAKFPAREDVVTGEFVFVDLVESPSSSRMLYQNGDDVITFNAYSLKKYCSRIFYFLLIIIYLFHINSEIY